MTAPFVRRPPTEAELANRRAVFAICRQFRIDRGERLAFASYLLGREVSSYRDLSPADWSRIRDGFEGAVWVCKIQMERYAAARR